MEKAPEHCILCGTGEREPLIDKDSWQIHRCESCGLGFVGPRPSGTELRGLYSEAYFADQYDTGLEPGTSEF